ncbi:hypothetical protein ABZ372_32650 [Streptomyces sp. NPDC005921]
MNSPSGKRSAAGRPTYWATPPSSRSVEVFPQTTRMSVSKIVSPTADSVAIPCSSASCASQPRSAARSAATTTVAAVPRCARGLNVTAARRVRPSRQLRSRTVLRALSA